MKVFKLSIYIVIIFIITISGYPSWAQTCCTGGVPISGNISFENNQKGSWQLGLVADYNMLNTLKEGSAILDDQSRKREVQSLLLRTGYNITDEWVAGLVVPYVRQERNIEFQNNINSSYTQGPGDIIFFSQYQLPFSNIRKSYQAGLGLKFPTGPADVEDSNGLTYNMDMQPGSGSMDWFFWGSYKSSFSKIPSLNFSAQIFYRLNGDYNNYLSSAAFQFGNEWQLITGLNKQWFIFNQVFNTSLMLKTRSMKKNELNQTKIPNTGGTWYYLIPSITYKPKQNISLSLSPEIPVYSQLNGTQLTTSFRIRAGVSIILNNQKDEIQVNLNTD